MSDWTRFARWRAERRRDPDYRALERTENRLRMAARLAADPAHRERKRLAAKAHYAANQAKWQVYYANRKTRAALKGGGMIVETLEPVWSGELEARGDAPGLSNYVGRSTLCGAMELLEALAQGDAGRVPGRARGPRTPTKWPALTVETSAAILALLQRGVSYNGVVTTLGKRGIVCSRDQARKVGRDHAIVRGKQAA